MPRYFFHVADGQSVPDNDGIELADIEEAKCEAVKLAGQLICDHAAQFWDQGDWRMTVTDESSLTLFELMFVGIEAAAITKKPLPLT